MVEPESSQDAGVSARSVIVTLGLTIVGLAYLVAQTLGLIEVRNRVGWVEVAIFAVILVANSPLFNRLEELAVSTQGVTFRVQKQVQQLKTDVTELQFLFKYFVNRWELLHLQKLNLPGPFDYEMSPDFEGELRHLRALGFIDNISGRGLRSMPPSGNLKDHFFITEHGVEYLNLRAKLKVDAETRTTAGVPT